MSVDYLARLRTDSRARDSRKRMEKRGVKDSKRWDRIIEQVATAPAWYAILSKETKPQKEKRRAALAAKIQALADELRADFEGRQFRVFDHGSVTTSNVAGRPTVADYLDDLADVVVRRSDINAARLFDRQINLKTYALRFAFAFLSDAQEIRRRAPNRETELLVSALLDENIPAGTWSQVNRKERRTNDGE